MLAGRRIVGSHELRVLLQFLKHPSVFATNRAVHRGNPSAFGNSTRGTNRHGAVDDNQLRLKQLSIPRNFAYEVSNLKRKADVQNFHAFDLVERRANVYTHGVSMLRN